MQFFSNSSLAVSLLTHTIYRRFIADYCKVAIIVGFNKGLKVVKIPHRVKASVCDYGECNSHCHRYFKCSTLYVARTSIH